MKFADSRSSRFLRQLRNEAVLRLQGYFSKFIEMVPALAGEHSVLYAAAHYQRHVLASGVPTVGRADPGQRAKPTRCSSAAQQEAGESKRKHLFAVSAFIFLRRAARHKSQSIITAPAVNTFCISVCTQVIKMLVVVVALFALCWLPLQTYNVLQDIFPQINE